jgi:hypothetical protein
VIAARRRRGFAVAAALYMLAAIAGLAAASFYAVVEARRAANRFTRQEEAASTAEAGLRAALETWDLTKRDSLAVGAIDSATSLLAWRGGAGVRAYVIRLTSSVYWIASPGEAATGTSVEAKRTYNLLVEILRPHFPVRAALVSGGNVVAGGEVTMSGHDAAPPGWIDCPSPDTAAAPSIIVADGAAATFGDGRPIPKVEVDTAATAISSYRTFGRVAASGLAGRSTITVAPGAIVSPAPDTARDCQPADPPQTIANWGDPTRTGRGGACESFFPVVHALGDLAVGRGRGQGVLLVSGNLQIEGPFLFNGVIVTAGRIDASGPDVGIYGVVASASPEGVVWRAEGALQRSSCAVARAADAARRAYPLPLRAWADLF